MIKRHSQIGDTIVEVLIALTVVSSVIAISYATARRALIVGQRAHERSEALKLAEGQLETLKAMGAETGADDIYAASNDFCVNTSTARVITQTSITDTVTSLPVGGLISQAAPAGINIYADTCRKGLDNRYFISIDRTDAGTESTFTVRIRWDGYGTTTGNGIEELSLVYKLHKANFNR